MALLWLFFVVVFPVLLQKLYLIFGTGFGWFWSVFVIQNKKNNVDDLLLGKKSNTTKMKQKIMNMVWQKVTKQWQKHGNSDQKNYKKQQKRQKYNQKLTKWQNHDHSATQNWLYDDKKVRTVLYFRIVSCIRAKNFLVHSLLIYFFIIIFWGFFWRI